MRYDLVIGVISCFYFLLKAKNFENLWEVHVRRNVLIKILDEWAKTEGDEASVEVNNLLGRDTRHSFPS